MRNHRSLTIKSVAGHIEPPAETFTFGFVRETAQGYTVVSDETVIRTALELLSRRISRGPLLSSPRVTRDYLRLRFADLQHEVFCLLYLDLCAAPAYVYEYGDWGQLPAILVRRLNIIKAVARALDGLLSAF